MSYFFRPGSVKQVTLPQANEFQDQFQIYFCDDLDDLKKHYFHDFQVNCYMYYIFSFFLNLLNMGRFIKNLKLESIIAKLNKILSFIRNIIICLN